jgi:hypothetical protein
MEITTLIGAVMTQEPEKKKDPILSASTSTKFSSSPSLIIEPVL